MTGTMVSVMPPKKEPVSEFGRRVVALRRARGMTQTDLARAIGSTQQMVSYYETAATYPPAEVIIKLAKTLRVSADHLLGLEPARGDGQGGREARLLWRKLRQILSLPERDRRAIVRLISSLLSRSRAA